MRLVDQLVAIANNRRAPFLLIGGHAVAAHGFARQTYDLDLLVSKGSRQVWIEELAIIGYSLFHDGGSFLQFNGPENSAPLDLMLVGDGTFTAMLDQACDTQWEGTSLKIPSLQHLFALKLHALKGAPEHRRIKDMHDVLSLIEINKVDVRSDSFRLLCEKYGSPEVYEKIIRLAL